MRPASICSVMQIKKLGQLSELLGSEEALNVASAELI
jgi:hypothetical protein